MSTSRASDFFSPRRFARLARQQLREQALAWGVFVLVLAVVLALVVALNLLADDDRRGQLASMQVPVYFFGLMLSGYIVAHRVYGPLQRRETALLQLMRPASVFEKWLLSALLLLVLYPLSYTLVYVLLFGPAVSADHGMALRLWEAKVAAGMPGAGDPPDPRRFAVFWPLFTEGPVDDSLSRPKQAAWFLAYAMLMGYASATLTWFRRHAGVRALVLGIALGLLTGLLWSVLKTDQWVEVLSWWFEPADQRLPLPLPAHLISLMFWLGVPLMLWATSWCALHERELS